MARGRLTLVSAADRLAELPDAAVWCRDLRHAWPRTQRDLARFVELEPLVLGAGGRVVEAVRTMYCTGRCGVRRVDKVRRTHNGGWERLGRPALRYPQSGYLLSKALPGQRVETVEPELVRDAVIRRMFPDLDW